VSGQVSPVQDPILRLVGRQRAIVWGGLVAVAGLAWLYLLLLARGMSGPGAGGRMVDLPGMGPALTAWTTTDVLFTLSMWAAMMVAMMLPAAAPMIMLFAAVNRRRRSELGVAVPTGIFVLGHLLVWTAFSVGATLAQWGLHTRALLSPAMATTSPLVGGALLMAAGVYQLTSLKTRCLTHCRSPLGFLMTAWREGGGGALRMGLHHGVYCLGCCWVLMALLFVTGVMNLLWVAVITAFVLVEKVGPDGVVMGRLAGLLMILAGLIVLGHGSRLVGV
jgi:predicted metal-binding membrane protein